MQDPRTRLIIALLLLVVFVLLMAVVARSERPMPVPPTADEPAVRTAAVGTYVAYLTATASSAPTMTSTPLPVETDGSATGVSGTPDCLGLRFIRDVTIPDNTEMTPAQVFTKSWLVENAGTCPWRPGFQVVLIGGLAMGGSPFRVGQTVGPGGQIQVSIKMAAPTTQTGIVQGTWMMTDAEGSHFGDFLSVVIAVTGPTRVPASASSPTATP